MGEPEEWVEALDADTGQMLWRHSLRTGDAAQAVLGAGKSPAVGLFPVGGRPTVAVVADGGASSGSTCGRGRRPSRTTLNR